MTVCLIRPENDFTANAMSRWWERIQQSVPPQAKLIDIRGQKATRESVEQVLDGASVVFFLGHGTKSCLQGDLSCLIDSLNVGLAKGCVILALACWSAAELGPNAVAAGVKAYLGFTDRFSWPVPFEEHFGRAAMAAARELLKGNSAEIAAQAAKTEFVNLFQFFNSGGERDHPDWVFALAFAKWNYETITVLGDHGVAAVSPSGLGSR